MFTEHADEKQFDIQVFKRHESGEISGENEPRIHHIENRIVKISFLRNRNVLDVSQRFEPYRERPLYADKSLIFLDAAGSCYGFIWYRWENETLGNGGGGLFDIRADEYCFYAKQLEKDSIDNINICRI